MKEAIVHAGPSVKIVDSPIPSPEKDQVLIKVAVSGSNPKDWKIPDWMGKNLNTGDDIAGVVHAVGPNVTEFKKGDRVAAFHEMMTGGGSFAEYAISWKHTTFALPPNATFEEGAALPLAYLTAVVGLYARLALPQPWTPRPDDAVQEPLLIYGASSAVGTYTLQLARASNIHPIIAVAGRAQAHVEQYLDRSKGDTIVDYRSGDDAVRSGIKSALNGKELRHAYDAVSEKGSVENIASILSPSGAVTFVLPGREYPGFPESVNKTTTTVGDVHGPLKDLGYVFCRYLAKGLEEGSYKAQPQEVVPGGLEGVQKGLENLKDGTASAVKYVFRIGDTPGAGSGS